MSQLKVYGPNESDPLAQPLTSLDQIIEIFVNAETPKNQWLVGIEYEMFGQIDRGLKPLPYEGPISINELFLYLVNKFKHKSDPYQPVYEDENLVALTCNRAVVALEPGGQIEIALRPYHSVSDVIENFSDVVREICSAAQDLNIDIFSLGIHPLAGRDDMAKVKKARYDIMRNYMGHIKGHGLDMMTRSAAIQINLDYVDEKDMVLKTRLLAALVPFYSLLCSSAAFVDKKPTSHAVERGHVWRTTDPARTGIPKIFFEDTFGYVAWINFVLDVPMYFIRRGAHYHDVAGSRFRDFMAHGLKGHTATVRDFVDHMSTVFTEIRLKPIIELRSPDSLPLPYTNAIIAFTWALIYDDNGRNLTSEIFAGLTHKELVHLHDQVIDHGRKAQFRGSPIYTATEKLLSIATRILKNHNHNEDILRPLLNLVKENITFAEWIRKHFANLDEKESLHLIKSFSPLSDPLATTT